MWRPEVAVASLVLEMVPRWTPNSTIRQRAPRRSVPSLLSKLWSFGHTQLYLYKEAGDQTEVLTLVKQALSWLSRHPSTSWVFLYNKKNTLKSLECSAVKSNCYTFGILCVPGNIHLLPPPPLCFSFPFQFTLKWSLAVMRVPLSTESCLIISMLNVSDSSQSQGFWGKGAKVWHQGPLTTCGKLSFTKFHITRKMKKCEECLRGQGTELEQCPSIILVCLTHFLAALIILNF